MDFKKTPGSNRGRILVTGFFATMGVLFALTALTFEPSPAQYTIAAVAGAMFVAALWGLSQVLKNR